MRRSKSSSISVFLVFISVIFSQIAYAGSSVWKVVDGENELFIGGTVHVLTKSDYPLPAPFEEAYHQATTVVFETDIQKMNSPETQMKLLDKVTYSDGRNLKTVLNSATFQQLEQYLANRGVPVAGMMTFKPGMVAMTLTVLELQHLGLMGAGVDEFFHSKAVNDRKNILQFETVDEQVNFVSEMGVGQENELIAYTLRDMSRLPSLMQSIKVAWRHGDHHKLEEVALSPLKNEFPGIFKELIVDRNAAWVQKIETMLKTKEVELILVGALHLVGDEGVLARLSALGYDIQKL